MSKHPIGFFDSGIGGTSIWKEVKQLLPYENTVYLCDSRNAPYGTKSKEKILEISQKNVEHLLSFNCKLIVVACNTATTNAISYLRSHYDIPFIGIEPAIKPASLVTKNKSIGVLATKGTLDSELFEQTSNRLHTDITILSREGTGIVELMESGNMNSEDMTKLLQHHLRPFAKEKVDALVLGCTHYPYLIPQIQSILGEGVQIIDSGKAVAKQTKAVLEQHNIQTKSEELGFHVILTNGDPEVVSEVVASDENVSIRRGIF